MRGRTTVVLVALGVLAFGGTATAATEAAVLLGRSNVAKTTTGLTNTRGTPLSLTAGRGQPPLEVNSSAEVPKLNASLVDGQSVTQIEAAARAGEQPAITGSCPPGQAIAAINPDGTVGCVQLTANTGTTIPPSSTTTSTTTTTVPGGGNPTSQGWSISQVQISSEAYTGEFQAVALVTNHNTSAQDAGFTVTVFNGQTIVGTLQADVNAVPSGATETAQFVSTSPYTTYTSWTFQTDYTFAP